MTMLVKLDYQFDVNKIKASLTTGVLSVYGDGAMKEQIVGTYLEGVLKTISWLAEQKSMVITDASIIITYPMSGTKHQTLTSDMYFVPIANSNSSRLLTDCLDGHSMIDGSLYVLNSTYSILNIGGESIINLVVFTEPVEKERKPIPSLGPGRYATATS